MQLGPTPCVDLGVGPHIRTVQGHSDCELAAAFSIPTIPI